MLQGSIVALVTPMAPNGDVDWAALESLIEWHVAEGTHGIVPMGTTGESPTLDTGEHLAVIKRTIEVVAGRVPVVAGTGSNATREAIHQTQEAQEAGADACLLVTPYYNKPTQAGLIAHYEAIAAETDVPLVLYNVPSRTACDMQAETVATLSELGQIIGIKEACGDANRVGEIRSRVKDDFIILSGEDAQTLDMLKLGATGTITVTANVLPRLMAQFCDAFLSGDQKAAAKIDADLQPIHEILFCEPSPTATKWALCEMGKIDSGIRLPLVPLTESNHEEVRNRLRAIGALA
ncbi:MAG: 4-hydroxy-tetrahydrodipicolinate synthase [Pseudomonadales bacterium]|nr:4-hydroxy-tetrahydrodipicolinate synthase [Pseudomonadales bacterium]